jgi:hypothetical protein
MQLTTPIEPAMAVSTAINTLRSCPQFTLFCILDFLFSDKFIFFIYPPRQALPIEGEKPEGRGGLLCFVMQIYNLKTPMSIPPTSYKNCV